MKIDPYHNHVTLFVCLACQRKCPQCSQKGLMKWKPKYQMSLDEIKLFVDYTKQSNCDQFKSIIVSGGEPLLWRHLEEGVQIIQKSCLARDVNIFSNGMNVRVITQRLINNINVLRVSRYSDNKFVLFDLMVRFGPKKIVIVDREIHCPIPKTLFDNVLPAQCGCEGYALCDNIMYACPMVPTISQEMGFSLQDFPETYCALQPHWVEILDKFKRANHLFCRACIGNWKIRKQLIGP